MSFLCNTCGSTHFERVELRGDGKRVLFCKTCQMGMIEHPPVSTDIFYKDGYYGASTGEPTHQVEGYSNYETTAAHTQLWVQLLISAFATGSSVVLDIGCADGSMLTGLPDRFTKLGIEANAAAAGLAKRRGVTVLSNDVADPVILQHSGMIDIVSSIATFEHVLDMRAAFQTALRLLKPQGLLIFEVPLISDTVDNKDWFFGSYEHISYPTIAGLTYLLNQLAGSYWYGFESQIVGFSASYIAVVTRSESTFCRAKTLVEAMRSESDLRTLTVEERRLNIAYRLVHSFKTTPDLLLALPDLLEVAHSQPLLRRLSQLWHLDALKAATADYQLQQADGWKTAFENLSRVHEMVQEHLAASQATQAIQDENLRYHQNQVEQWKNAFNNLNTVYNNVQNQLASYQSKEAQKNDQK